MDNIEKVLAELVADGILRIVGFDEHGEPFYQITPGGQDAIDTRIRLAEQGNA